MSTQPGPLPLLEHDVLRTFVAISDTGSFSRAARHVFRTPSAVSMQIKRLEETLGRVLFVRDSRRVQLTPEGEALLGYARRLLEINEEAVSRFLAPEVDGTVRFGTADDVGTRILPDVLARFARSHPMVQVDVVVRPSAQLLDQLDAGELDLTLVTSGNEGQETGRGEIVYSERLGWAGRENGTAVEREPLPLALAAHGCAWRGLAVDALERAGRAYRVAYTSENVAGQEAALVADLAIAPLPVSLIRPPLRRLGDEVALPPLGAYHVALVRGPGRGRAADVLADQVVEHLHALGP